MNARITAGFGNDSGMNEAPLRVSNRSLSQRIQGRPLFLNELGYLFGKFGMYAAFFFGDG